jgi:hypothetical protein
MRRGGARSALRHAILSMVEGQDMAEPARRAHQEFTTRPGQPLIAIPDIQGGEEVVRYFNSFEDFDRATEKDPDSIQRALSLIGAWQDLDDEDGPDMLDELDRMRHASPPSPPLEL